MCQPLPLPTLFDSNDFRTVLKRNNNSISAFDTKDVIIEKEKICTVAETYWICTDFDSSCSLDPSVFSFSLLFLSSLSCYTLFYFLFFCPGSKAAPRPGGIGSAAAGQPGMEGEGMFSKILPGGAAEQAGKLGEGTTYHHLTTAHFKRVLWPWYYERHQFSLKDINLYFWPLSYW